MAPERLPNDKDDKKVSKSQAREKYATGATEDQMDTNHTVPQRINSKGSKIEDMAGTGEHDGSGG